jgi:UDP-GlcNAc:undecaprenyl-phosphate GlcNAc-1-phosphate transferase
MEAVTIRLLRRAAVIEIPGDRSSRMVLTPRGGGIPIAAGLLVAAGLIGGAIGVVFAFAVAAFGLLGFTEDLRGLAVGRRLIMQALGGLVVAVVLVSGQTGPVAVLVLLAALRAVWITGFLVPAGAAGGGGALAFLPVIPVCGPPPTWLARASPWRACDHQRRLPAASSAGWQ